MSCNQGNGRTLNHYALVSYIPDPLATFLDELRRELTPTCNPHAHLTVLPPRPFTGDEVAAIERLARDAAQFPAFQVTLGAIEVFPDSNVIYLGIHLGEPQVRALHGLLNTGILEHQCNFPFHPHVTLAQDFDATTVGQLAEKARAMWAAWTDSRSFEVDVLSFVKNVAIGHWDDLASIPLGPRPSA